ncbi:ABC transporter ATP-binding protein [Sporolactobacillus sp. THM7-4]|nr:ABC transporter ATP-binding protein [Sporolactobacillus sp. THM7-4]
MAVIELSHISKYYGKFAAVKDLSLTIDKGEFYGFIGPNGAGKSTTMNMILNFIKHNGGSIKLFGQELPEHDVEVKKKIGYVPGDVRFYSQLTVQDLFRYTLEFHHLKEDQKELDNYCELFQVDRKKKFGELSLGNKKKIAVICAMIHHPQLLILDEPTNGLDPLMHARLFHLMKEKQQEGVTIFLSSHNLKEVEDYCSKVAFIKQGELVGVEDLTKSRQKVKIILLRGRSLPIDEMKAIGAKCITQTEQEARFLYEKDLQQLFSVLASFAPRLDDVTVENRDLEEQFMSMYATGEARS